MWPFTVAGVAPILTGAATPLPAQFVSLLAWLYPYWCDFILTGAALSLLVRNFRGPALQQKLTRNCPKVPSDITELAFHILKAE